MATTTILLKEDVDNLGGRGEVVKVRAGYARNFLLPRGMALLATKSNIKQIEREKTALLKKAAEEKSAAETQMQQMRDISLVFERKVGEHGILFGSVTSMDIAEALKEKGYEIDRKRITLREAFKETGEYEVPVRLHREVVLNVPVTVIPEGGSVEELRKEKQASAEQNTEVAVSENAETPASDAETETDSAV